MITSDEIKRRLWNGADALRGSMDASRYKDYMLGLMFYKFLSDKTLQAFAAVSKISGETADIAKQYADMVAAMKKDNMSEGDNPVVKMVSKYLGYYVLPRQLYQSWVDDINKGEFELEKVTESLNSFERNVDSASDGDDFKGLFSGLDLTDTALGSSLKQRSDNIRDLILLFADLNMVELQENDILGDAYEYLIGMFAMESGKKAGEFYTPHFVSEVIAQIAAKSTKITSVYDPAVGSGSLLLTVKGHLSQEERKNLHYYGQEKNTATYNLTRMNLLLHGVRPDKMDIKNGDTLAEDWPEDPSRPGEGILFDAVVMNPPYSAKNWNRSKLKGTDPRFEFVDGILPPDNKGDYAFLLHGLYHLNPDKGVMGIVLPHGVLFRGAAEGEIRKRLIDKNCIDAVIGLPAGMFTNTGIPVIVMILRKDRKFDDPVMIIDSSKYFTKQGKQNVLRERDIAKIVDLYIERKEEPGYCHLADRNEIIANDYNLNIPRYVESQNSEIAEDVDAHFLGGIPEQNITELKVLNMVVPDVIKNNFSPLRKGYLQMNCTPDEFSREVKAAPAVAAKAEKLQEDVTAYIGKYWNILRNLTSADSIEKGVEIKQNMLEEIKSLLDGYEFLDKYEGYQIIADIWKNTLNHDINVIIENGFYNAGRMRIPNMITKGSGDKKHEEQDGFIGSIVDNNHIEKLLFADRLKGLSKLEEDMNEADSILSEMTENAKDDSNDEYSVLADCLNDAGEALDRKRIKAAIKEAEKGSDDRKLLEKCEKLFADKATMSKDLKNEQAQLKNDVQERILVLTDSEIDKLMYEKWFGEVVNEIERLVLMPLEAEIAVVKELYDRYSETLDDIRSQIAELTRQIADMEKDLVVTNE